MSRRCDESKAPPLNTCGGEADSGQRYHNKAREIPNTDIALGRKRLSLVHVIGHVMQLLGGVVGRTFVYTFGHRREIEIRLNMYE